MNGALILAILILMMAFFTMLEGHLLFAFILVWLAGSLAS